VEFVFRKVHRNFILGYRRVIPGADEEERRPICLAKLIAISAVNYFCGTKVTCREGLRSNPILD
jgi:hypothetical protein